jgi:hypothetical protein
MFRLPYVGAPLAPALPHKVWSLAAPSPDAVIKPLAHAACEIFSWARSLNSA